MSTKLRTLFGDRARYVTVFPDGYEVPWNPLTIGQYLQNIRDLTSVPPEEVEDKLFREQVTSDFLVKNMDILKSGTIATVAHNIVASSWPNSEEEFAVVFDFFRQMVNSPIENNVLFILRAFPAYTPDDIYAMDFEGFMHCLALAEKHMMEIGAIKKPLQKKKKLKTADLNSAEKQDFKEKWEEQRKVRAPKPQPFEVLPAPEFDGSDTVIGKQDLIPAEVIDDSPGDYLTAQSKMVKDTARFYEKYLQKDGRISPEDIKKGIEEKIKSIPEKEKESKQFAAQQFARLREKQRQKEVIAYKKFDKGLKKKRRQGK